MMDFIKEISEARMTRDQQNMTSLTYSDVGERMYLTLLCLEVMRHYPNYTPFVRNYAKKSQSVAKTFKVGATDLHNFLYFLQGDEQAIGKLKNPGAAKRQQAMSALPIKDIMSYITSLANGNSPTFPQQTFIRIENGLHINNKDYKIIRRYLSRFRDEHSSIQTNVVTKLLFAVRSKLRSSDIIDDFEQFVSKRDLESNKVTDTEPVISTPDISAPGSSIVYYARLLHKPSYALLNGFLNAARNRRIPTIKQLETYLPIIQMIDDIVKAGPAYVNMLKVVHKRAKNQD